MMASWQSLRRVQMEYAFGALTSGVLSVNIERGRCMQECRWVHEEKQQFFAHGDLRQVVEPES